MSRLSKLSEEEEIQNKWNLEGKEASMEEKVTKWGKSI